MIVLRELCPDSETDAATEPRSLTLPFQRRRLSRQRARLDDGEDVAIVLPRGTVLREGSVLRGDAGERIQVRARAERVSRIGSDDVLLLTRAAYHLGNRHVAVQIEKGRLSYLHDHVLDDLVLGLGLRVTVVEVPFEPESGAYAGYDARHDHEHVHEHSHSADHGHAGSDSESVP